MTRWRIHPSSTSLSVPFGPVSRLSFGSRGSSTASASTISVPISPLISVEVVGGQARQLDSEGSIVETYVAHQAWTPPDPTHSRRTSRATRSGTPGARPSRSRSSPPVLPRLLAFHQRHASPPALAAVSSTQFLMRVGGHRSAREVSSSMELRRDLASRFPRCRLLPAGAPVGLRLVYTPHAELVHHESGTIGPRILAGFEVTASATGGRRCSVATLLQPNLTRDSPDWGSERSCDQT
jgi:hypothetical protein